MTDPEAVLVAGASGGTGRAVLRALDDRPVTVAATTRDPAKAGRLRKSGADDVVVADLLDADDAAAAVADTDADAVCSAVGTSPLSVHGGGPYVDGTGNRNLARVAGEADVEHLVMVSALGVGEEPASALGSLFDLVVGPVQRAKAEGEAAVRDATVDHTILRAGALTRFSRADEPLVAEPGARLWGPVSRRAVGRLVAAAPSTPAARNRTFEVVSNPLLAGRGIHVDWRLPGSDGG